MIYLDNAATTRIDPYVLSAMLPWLTDKYGNPGALYDFGREAAEAVCIARGRVAAVFNRRPEQVLFTSGGSEGNNLVIKGVSDHLKKTGRTTVLYSAVEHDSVRHAVRDLCAEHGFSAKEIPVIQSGAIDMGALRSMVEDETVGLVSVMFVNNELGVPVWDADIAPLCRERGILTHCDCVQAAYDYDLDCSGKESPDFATISSHKIHGPKGVGAVYVEHPELLSPLISGGAEQEFGLRGGTENVAGIVGFGKACDLLRYGDSDTPRRDVDEYGAIFLGELSNLLGEEVFRVNGNGGKTVNICLYGVDAQSLVLAAGCSGVCLSAGSACRSSETSPSHVLKAIGLSDEDAKSSIRLSFSRMNNEYEVREGARVVASCVRMLKGASA